MQSQRFMSDMVGNISLPCHVFNGKKSCGHYKYLACLQHVDFSKINCKIVLINCGSRGCLPCGVKASKQEAVKTANRILAGTLLIQKDSLLTDSECTADDRYSRNLCHYAVTLPPKLFSMYRTKKGRQRLRSRIMKSLVNDLGFQGGMILDHAYRFERGLVKAKFSPHFHVIGLGFVNGERAIKFRKTNSDNFMIHFLSKLESYTDLVNKCVYMASHSTVFISDPLKRGTEHTVRYFGCMANNKYSTKDLLSNSVLSYADIFDLVTKKRIKKITKRVNGVSYTHDFPLKSIEMQSYTIHSNKDNLKAYDLKNYKILNTDSVYYDKFQKSLDNNVIIPLMSRVSDNFLNANIPKSAYDHAVTIASNPKIANDTDYEHLEQFGYIQHEQSSKVLRAQDQLIKYWNYQSVNELCKGNSAIAKNKNSDKMKSYKKDKPILIILMKFNYYVPSNDNRVDFIDSNNNKITIPVTSLISDYAVISLRTDNLAVCPDCNLPLERVTIPNYEYVNSEIKESHADLMCELSKNINSIFTFESNLLCDSLEYYRNCRFENIGMPYIDSKTFEIMYEDGVIKIPKKLDLMNYTARSLVTNTHTIQTLRAQHRLSHNGISANTDEIKQQFAELLKSRIAKLRTKESRIRDKRNEKYSSRIIALSMNQSVLS